VSVASRGQLRALAPLPSDPAHCRTVASRAG
jgi:hypothetical protein